MSVTLGVSLTRTGTAAFSITHSVIIWTYSGTWPTAAPMPRSLIPCGQPKLSSMPSAPVSLTRLTMSYQVSGLGLDHERDDHRVVRVAPLDLGDLGEVDVSIGRSLISSMLEMPTIRRPPIVERAQARGDVRDRLADRLPDDAAPTRVERPGDHLAVVRDGAGGQPERVRTADAGHVGEQVHARARSSPPGGRDDARPAEAERVDDRARGELAGLDGVHDLGTAVGDVADRPDLRIGGPARRRVGDRHAVRTWRPRGP